MDPAEIHVVNGDPNIILKWKPKSMTPNEQLDEIKKERNITEKACPMGKLDPMASGWMLYFLGNDATKLADSYMNHDKTYEFNIICGISTESMDCMGIIKELQLDYNKEKVDMIIDNIKKDQYNKYQQTMPSCSAYKARHKITRQIKALWEWHSLGELANVDIPISNIKLLNFTVLDRKEINFIDYVEEIMLDISKVKRFDQYQIAKILEQWNEIKTKYMDSDKKISMIRCSARVNGGTFIRYLCNMIGEDMKVPCHAQDITRVAIHF